ncbi:MAG TPA: DNA-processing protein DprA [Candidatus Saccharimonadales bacterium]
MEIQVINYGTAQYPVAVEQAHKPPKQLFYRGDLAAIMERRRVAIVGSRRMGPYGREVTAKLARELAEQGIVVVSGLALGVDAEAHRAAVEAGGLCLAILPTPVDQIAPISNRRLAGQILSGGGALLSQYPPGSEVHKGNFVARNELVAALSEVLVITEATHDSGSLHTANFAADMQTEVMAVPGAITSPLSQGTNALIRAGKAGVVTSSQDVLHALGIYQMQSPRIPQGSTPEEQQILALLATDMHDGEALLQASRQPVQVFNQTLTMLEIAGKIMPLGANRWGLP